MSNPFAAPANNPFSQPAPPTTPAPAAVSPFGQPSGQAAPAGDPFAQPPGGGSYPKLYDLVHELLWIGPAIKFEQVPDNFNQGEMVTRLTADLVICTGEHAGEEHHGMWFNQRPIVGAAEKLAPKGLGQLGRLRRFPTAADKKAGTYATYQDIDQALVNHRPGTPNIRFALALENHTPEDAELARGILRQLGRMS